MEKDVKSSIMPKAQKTHSLIIVAEGVMSAQELAGKILDGGYESRITVLGLYSAVEALLPLMLCSAHV